MTEANAVKPGTRCQCPTCVEGGDSHFGSVYVVTPRYVRQCTRDAVRMVTVTGRGNFEPIPGYEKANFRHVPMCAACAEYHERS